MNPEERTTFSVAGSLLLLACIVCGPPLLLVTIVSLFFSQSSMDTDTIAWGATHAAVLILAIVVWGMQRISRAPRYRHRRIEQNDISYGYPIRQQNSSGAKNQCQT